ncbi:TetR family transcriptional regulator [Siccirubricoccus deserti]
MGSDLAAMDRPGEGPGVQIPTVDRILSAAARLFAARGMAGVGLREITAEAG